MTILGRIREQILWIVNQVVGMLPKQYNDVDDCWVVALWWTARASDPDLEEPTITELRAWAKDPDDGYRDGGQPGEWIAAALGMWPDCGAELVETSDWATIQRLLGEHRPASAGISSAKLTTEHQHGFTGLHQIGLIYRDDSKLYLANPLAPQGSRPQQTSWAEIRSAMGAIYGDGKYRAVFFPPFQAALPAPEPAPAPVDTTPFSAADVAAAAAEAAATAHHAALAVVVKAIGDRLTQYRAINAEVNGSIHPDPLDLAGEGPGDPRLATISHEIRVLNEVRENLEEVPA